MSFISDLVGGGVKGLVSVVGDVADELTMSGEEKKELENEFFSIECKHQVDMKTLEVKEKELDVEMYKTDAEISKARIEDADSSRKYNTAVQTSEHSGWLAKQIQPALAFVIVSTTFYLYHGLIFGESTQWGNNRDIILLILGNLNAMSMGIISYYFVNAQQGVGVNPIHNLQLPTKQNTPSIMQKLNPLKKK